MLFLRDLYLVIVDKLIALLTIMRRVASYGPSDLKFLVSDSIVIKDFFPYDLVTVSTEDPVESLNDIPVIGCSYKIGTVIGYKGLDKTGNPIKIKVAHFNTGELDVPEVRYYNPKDLNLVFSTVQYARFYSETLSLSDKLNHMLQGLDPIEDEGEDGGGESNGGSNIIH